ncbi:MAG: hypothetical protein JSS27_03285 [Planctomycetes bacterium]|nr:hypothetical protein [Planctomycetota bacterium]
MPTSVRAPQFGAFPNWLLGLAELVLRERQAEAYLMCQDDVVFCRGVREYLEHSLWPAEKVGVISLFCPSHYARGKPAGFHVEDRGWDTWGAQAYVFSPAAADALLSSPVVWNHRRTGPNEGNRNIDSVIGYWCRQTKLPYFVHTPSLAQHVGTTSTLYYGASTWGNRIAADFMGEDRTIWEVNDK